MTRDAQPPRPGRRRSAPNGPAAATDAPPETLDSAVLFAPAGELVPSALAALDRGGTLALAGIYLSQIPPLDYDAPPVPGAHAAQRHGQHAARTAEELLRLAAEIPIRPHTRRRSRLEDANEALRQLKHDGFEGAAVLQVR